MAERSTESYRVEIDEYGMEEWFRPNGERLALVEMMEDRTYFRDLAPLLDELNTLYQTNGALVAALEGLFPLLNEFEGQSYGIFLGGDPRDFSPDTDCCTPEEIARWEQACAEWAAGQGTDRGPGCATFGDASAWTGSGFGVGTTTRTQPEMEHARAALRLAKGESS